MKLMRECLYIKRIMDIYIEYYVVDNLTADDINKYVTEISVRIDSNCDR